MTVVDGATGREEKYTYNTDPLKLMPCHSVVTRSMDQLNLHSKFSILYKVLGSIIAKRSMLEF